MLYEEVLSKVLRIARNTGTVPEQVLHRNSGVKVDCILSSEAICTIRKMATFKKRGENV